jgi:hypothetical protein
MRQQMSRTSHVHFLRGNAARRIPGYECVYSELKSCSGTDIIGAASQGDCPAVVASCTINSSRDFYQQAVDLLLRGIARFPTLMSPVDNPLVLRVAEAGFSVLKVLVKYFGIGGIYESENYNPVFNKIPPDGHPQQHLFTLSNWHGHPCVLIDSALYPGIDIQSTLNTTQWKYYSRVQLYVIASCPTHEDGIVTLNDITDIMRRMQMSQGLADTIGTI